MRSIPDSIFDTSMADLDLLLRYLRNENESDGLANAQLHRELQQHANLGCQNVLHPGVKDCVLYTRLPPEVRQHIFSYIVCVPESIHIYPVKGNPRLGYRLSKCPDNLINSDSGACCCESGFRPPPTPPAFLDTELLLVSKSVRREVLDLIFLHNKFTFTSLGDFNKFTDTFTVSAAKMQHVRLYQRLSDYHFSSHTANHTTKTRARIGHLKTLELNCYLDNFSCYDTRYNDGFLLEVLPLAFPKPEFCKVTVKPHRIFGGKADKELMDSVNVVQRKLNEVFEGKYKNLKDVPIAQPPKKRVPECEKEPLVKRGILALSD